MLDDVTSHLKVDCASDLQQNIEIYGTHSWSHGVCMNVEQLKTSVRVVYFGT